MRPMKKLFDVAMMDKARVVVRLVVEGRKEEQEQSSFICSDILSGEFFFSLETVNSETGLHS
jgi:hypothetical protein